MYSNFLVEFAGKDQNLWFESVDVKNQTWQYLPLTIEFNKFFIAKLEPVLIYKKNDKN